MRECTHCTQKHAHFTAICQRKFLRKKYFVWTVFSQNGEKLGKVYLAMSSRAGQCLTMNFSGLFQKNVNVHLSVQQVGTYKSEKSYRVRSGRLRRADTGCSATYIIHRSIIIIGLSVLYQLYLPTSPYQNHTRTQVLFFIELARHFCSYTYLHLLLFKGNARVGIP